jgi:aspartate-semialdehyde dehydrogenase
MKARIAVIGATGAVGREILNVLAERDIPVEQVHGYASDRSLGTEVSYGEDDVLQIAPLEGFGFHGIDIALFAGTEATARTHVPRAVAAGAWAIDVSTAFRMEPGVPLIVPEVNGDMLSSPLKKRIIASPSTGATVLALALRPLHLKAGVRRAVVTTFEPVSEGGRVAMDELFQQTRAIFVNQTIEKSQFTKQIAFNVIPHVGGFENDGSTSAESGLERQLRKILDPDVAIAATAVRVPVFLGHCQAVHVELAEPLSAEAARAAFKSMPGITVIDHRTDDGYVTPVECAGDDDIYISRVRKDSTVAHGIAFWLVADNLRKGAATNAVQIAERLMANKR